MRIPRSTSVLHAVLLAALCCTAVLPCGVPEFVGAVVSGDTALLLHHAGDAAHEDGAASDGQHAHPGQPGETLPCGCCVACLLCNTRYAQVTAQPTIIASAVVAARFTVDEAAPRSTSIAVWRPPKRA